MLVVVLNCIYKCNIGEYLFSTLLLATRFPPSRPSCLSFPHRLAFLASLVIRWVQLLIISLTVTYPALQKIDLQCATMVNRVGAWTGVDLPQLTPMRNLPMMSNSYDSRYLEQPMAVAPRIPTTLLSKRPPFLEQTRSLCDQVANISCQFGSIRWNKTLDRSTYPGWKISCVAIENFILNCEKISWLTSGTSNAFYRCSSNIHLLIKLFIPLQGAQLSPKFTETHYCGTFLRDLLK